MKIAVFCSANEHITPDFFSLTEEFGKWMAQILKLSLLSKRQVGVSQN